MDQFRVIDLKPSLAVTKDPFFSATTRGSRLKEVLNFVGYLTSTVSLGLILLDFVPSFEYAYALIFVICSTSLSAIIFRVSCKVCCLADGGDTSGRVVLSLLPFSVSFGDAFVVVCGAARCCLNCTVPVSNFVLNDSSSHTPLKRSASSFAFL